MKTTFVMTAHAIDFNDYPGQLLDSLSYKQAVAAWATPANRDPLIGSYTEPWIGVAYLTWQKQFSSLCGLHALNALHASSGAQVDPTFPFYTKAMLDAAKEHTKKIMKSDWSGLEHKNDYTDPPTMMILARNRGDFLIQVDMHDQSNLQYLNGLYPLPNVGVWILTYPGHHVTVYRVNEEFAILDSLEAHMIRCHSKLEYVKYVQKTFGQIYSYLILYDATEATGDFAPVVKKDKETWAIGNRVLHSNWGDFETERKNFSAGEIIPVQGFFEPHVLKSIEDFLPLPNPANAPAGWANNKYSLEGLSVPSTIEAQSLLKRRHYLEDYLSALENTLGDSGGEFDTEIRSLATEGRVLLRPDRFMHTSPGTGEIYRESWLVLITSLTQFWLSRKIESIFDSLVQWPPLLQPVSDLMQEWKDNLNKEWGQVIKKEIVYWLQADWEYLPLNREFYQELVRSTKWGIIQEDRKGGLDHEAQRKLRLKSIMPLILRWMPTEETEKMGSIIRGDGELERQATELGVDLSSQTLLDETIGFGAGDLYQYLEDLIVFEVNTRWNPLEIIKDLDRVLDIEERTQGFEFSATRNVDGKAEDDWLKIFTTNLFCATFHPPNDVCTFFDQEFNQLVTAGWSSYRSARESFLNLATYTSPNEFAGKYLVVGLPFLGLVPTYYTDIAGLSEVQRRIDYFRRLVGVSSRRERWENIFQRAFNLPEWGRNVKSVQGEPNPIPYQIWLDPDDLNDAIRRLTKGEDEIETLSRLFGDAGTGILFLVIDKVSKISAKHSIGSRDIWIDVLQAYRKRRLSFSEDFDVNQLTRILVLEEIDSVEYELGKIKEIRLNQKEEIIIGAGTTSGQKARGLVQVKVESQGHGHLQSHLQGERDDRLFNYRWRFEHESKRGSLIHEWFDGPKTSHESVVELEATMGSGILSCEVYVLYVGGGNPQYVSKVTCPNSLVLRVLHTCVRCNKTYNRAENHHGACFFHPPPNPAQAFLISQAQTPNTERNWSYFLKMLDMYWDYLPVDSKTRFLDATYKTLVDYLPPRIPQEDDHDFDHFFMNLEKLPFSLVVSTLNDFPWTLAVESKYGRIAPYVTTAGLAVPPTSIVLPPNTQIDESKILPKTIRQWLASLPISYLQTVHAKWCEFQGTRGQLEKKQNYGYVQKLPQSYSDLVTVACDIYNKQLSNAEKKIFFARLGDYGLADEHDLEDWRDDLLRRTPGIDQKAITLLKNHFPWAGVFEGPVLENIRKQLGDLERIGKYVDPMDENSPDPAKMQLVRIAPANLWVDDNSSSRFWGLVRNGGFDYKTVPRACGPSYLPEPLQSNQQQQTRSRYGYDISVGKWQCCGKRDVDAPGCWIDVHSEKMPYVRFIGHKENNDTRGSWPVNSIDDFEYLWRSIENSSNLQHAQTLVMRYFGMQCRMSGYNPGETVYWPIAKESDQCKPFFRRSSVPSRTDPSLPKRGFAAWETQIPLLDLLEQVVHIQKKGGVLPAHLEALIKTINKFNLGNLVSKIVYAPFKKNTVPKNSYAGITSAPDDEDDDLFDGPISAMPILTLSLWYLLESFIDAMPITSLSMLTSGIHDVPLVV